MERIVSARQHTDVQTNVGYAVQTCDRVYINSEVNDPGLRRFCGDDKALLIRKSLTSLLQSIRHCADRIPYSRHEISIFDDHSSDATMDFIQRLMDRFADDRIAISVETLEGTGAEASMRTCFDWMSRRTDGLVYIVQDDFLFTDSCIFEMVDIYNQMVIDHPDRPECIILPTNDPTHWTIWYRYQFVETMIVPGRHRYWMSTHDIPAGFMTTPHTLRQNWDLISKYFTYKVNDVDAERCSISNIPRQYRTIALRPMDSVAFHMQWDAQKEPYIPWQPIWDAVPDI